MKRYEQNFANLDKMEEYPTGEYVLYADHMEELAAKDALISELKWLVAEAGSIIRSPSDLWEWKTDWLARAREVLK
jgi:hypothetical protein